MKRTIRIALILTALLVLALELIHPEYTSAAKKNEMISTVLTRALGSAFFLVLIKKNSISVFGITHNRRALLAVLPALVIALNNAPIIGLATGAARVESDLWSIILLIAQSAAVGLFEEAAFRGFFFPIILEKTKGRSIFFATVISSALFAAVHLLNLFYGSSPAAVILQVGYSFLIGGMCAIVLIKTRCIWICAALHAVYNFGGTLIPTLGSGKVWDAATVSITAVLSVLVIALMLTILSRVKKEEITFLYTK